MPEGPPAVSIVVPTFERPDQLRECLASLAALDYPRDRYEVIVVDDGGSQAIEPIVTAFRPGVDVTVIRQANAGPAAARNTGAAHAGGQVLAFTDDDCRVDPGWLRGLTDALAAAPGSMVGGQTVNDASGIYPAMSQLIVDVVYRHYNRDPMQARFLASNNVAFPADGFREVGGFDPDFRFAEDRDLCDRWRHSGRRIVHTPAALVYHAHRMGARGFCRQHFQYGRGAERFSRHRAARGSGSMLSERRFHLAVMNWIGYPIRHAPPRRALPVAALLGLWQTANFAGYVYERLRRAGGLTA